ncbi:MAG: 2-hydroxyacyl-CoA dehydratase family protein [Lachnospiraceae bacterium]|nr:2-hydroxyacyl-CoA dehydratase family protein [Lachnospiraceae bacterium]
MGTYCVMAPQELIYAAGAVPVKLCSGSYTAFAIGDELVPRDACPLVKAVAGFQSMGVMPIYDECSLMVIPITCDCKKKMAGMLEEKCNVFTMQVPIAKEDDDIEQYIQELYQLIGKLENVTGNRVTYQSLREGMELVGYAQYELSRFLEYKKKMPYLIQGTHVMAMMNAFAYMEEDAWAEQVRRLNLELKMRVREKKKVTGRQLPRIMLTGSPIIFPNIKIPLLIEEMGGIVAADETCMGERGMYDPAVPVDDSFDGIVRALANRSIRPCTCPTFARNRQRIYRIRQMIEDFQIQGVVYHVLRGCLVYDFEYRELEEILGTMGIPIIRVESDYNEEDVEQIRIRIEAFIELIKMQHLPGTKNQ